MTTIKIEKVKRVGLVIWLFVVVAIRSGAVILTIDGTLNQDVKSQIRLTSDSLNKESED